MVNCPNCNTSNNEHAFRCSGCDYILRDRVVNIDLWSFFLKILASPSIGLQNVLRAEHKNFVFTILIFVSIKVLINAQLIATYITNYKFRLYYIILSPILLVIIVYLFSLILAKVAKKRGVPVTVFDTLSVYTYSLIPYFVALLSITIFEFVVYGGFLFSKAPSPLEIKKGMFYLFTFLEIATLLWSILLSIISTKLLFNKRITAIVLSIALHAIINGAFLAPLLLIR